MITTKEPFVLEARLSDMLVIVCLFFQMSGRKRKKYLEPDEDSAIPRRTWNRMNAEPQEDVEVIRGLIQIIQFGTFIQIYWQPHYAHSF